SSPLSERRSSASSSESRWAPCERSSRMSCLKVARACGSWRICSSTLASLKRFWTPFECFGTTAIIGSRYSGGMQLKSVHLTIPDNGNIILGQSHFIKSVEDIYEAIVNTSPHIQFGIAFNEASGDCLTRFDGNDEALKQNAIANATVIGAGHVFVVALRNGFPIN